MASNHGSMQLRAGRRSARLGIVLPPNTWWQFCLAGPVPPQTRCPGGTIVPHSCCQQQVHMSNSRRQQRNHRSLWPSSSLRLNSKMRMMHSCGRLPKTRVATVDARVIERAASMSLRSLALAHSARRSAANCRRNCAPLVLLMVIVCKRVCYSLPRRQPCSSCAGERAMGELGWSPPPRAAT